MTVKQRLIEFLKYNNISQSKFEKACNLSNGYVNNLKNDIGYDKRQSINLQFPDLSLGWLLVGEGTMLRKNTLKYDEKQEENIEIIALQKDAIDNLKEIIVLQKDKIHMLEEKIEGLKHSKIPAGNAHTNLDSVAV